MVGLQEVAEEGVGEVAGLQAILVEEVVKAMLVEEAVYLPWAALRATPALSKIVARMVVLELVPKILARMAVLELWFVLVAD